MPHRARKLIEIRIERSPLLFFLLSSLAYGCSAPSIMVANECTNTSECAAGEICNNGVCASAIELSTSEEERTGSTTTTDFVTRTNPVLLVVSGDGQSSQVDSLLETPIVLEARDTAGKALAGVTVTMATTDGTTEPSTLVSDSAGRMSVSWRLGTRAGSQQLSATIAGQSTGLTLSATAQPTALASINKIDGDAQTADPGFELANPLVVQVRDAFGNLLQGQPVTFAVLSGDSILLDASPVLSDDQGRAAVRFKMGGSWGAVIVRASAGQFVTDFMLTAATPLLSVFAGDNTSAQVDTVTTVVAKLMNQHGLPQAGVPVSFSVQTGGGSISGDSIRFTDSDGKAAASVRLGTATGLNTFLANIQGVENVIFHVDGHAGPPANFLKISGDGQAGQVATVLNDPFIVEVQDTYGNPVPGASVTFSSNAGGSYDDAPTHTGPDGRAAAYLRLPQTVTTSSEMGRAINELGVPVFFSSSAFAGPGASLKAISPQLDYQVIKCPPGEYATPPKVQVVDAYGNATSGAVDFTLSSSALGGFTPNNTTSIRIGADSQGFAAAGLKCSYNGGAGTITAQLVNTDAQIIFTNLRNTNLVGNAVFANDTSYWSIAPYTPGYDVDASMSYGDTTGTTKSLRLYSFYNGTAEASTCVPVQASTYHYFKAAAHPYTASQTCPLANRVAIIQLSQCSDASCASCGTTIRQNIADPTSFSWQTVRQGFTTEASTIRARLSFIMGCNHCASCYPNCPANCYATQFDSYAVSFDAAAVFAP